ncbi:MAG: TolB family protein [Bacillota bacterium]
MLHTFSRQIVAGLLLTLLLAGCAEPKRQEAASPEPPAPSPPAGAPRTEPKPEPAPLAFTLTVNGREVTDGAVVKADYYAHAELRLRFPVAMDRRSVDYIRKRLPKGTTLDWEDERTSRMRVPPGGSFAINLAGAQSLDGSAAVKAGLVEVRREEYSRLSLYRPAELMAGREGVTGRWRPNSHQNGIALSPDRTQALFFSPDPFGRPWPPWLVDLTTGQERPVPVPDTDHWFSAGGWLPDGRIYLLGKTLWVSDPSGEAWREVAGDLFNWVARLSPDGTRIATWSPTEPESLLVVDFDGQKRLVKGPFRRPGADGGISVAWSPDGQWLAGSDHDSQATGEGPRIRIVDAVGDRPGRTIEGVTLVTWLSTGDLVAYRRPYVSAKRGDPDPGVKGELLRIDSTGKERPLLDRWAQPSPDGAHLLLSEWDGQRQVLSLVESATGKQVELPLPHWARWTDQGEIMVLEGPLRPAPPAAAARPLSFTARVGEVELQPRGAALAGRDRETEVLISFPRPMDRPSVEDALRRALPEGAQLTWEGEQQLRLTVPPGETFLINADGALSPDGQGKVEAWPVTVYRLRPVPIRLYSFEAALQGRAEVLEEWELPGFSGGLALSPDRSQALLYHVDTMSAGPPAVMVDLATGQWRTLALPGLETHGHAYGGFLPDGRLLVAGNHVWIGDGRGEAMKALTQKPRRTWTATVSPDGARVALWGPGRHPVVIDLKSGEERPVEGLIPSTSNDMVYLAWSPDSTRLAATAWNDDQGWRAMEIAVVDLQSGRRVRTIEDAAVSAWVEAGIIGQRRNKETRRDALLLFSETGERELGDTWFRLSPDGRYLLQGDQQSQAVSLWALEIATGKRIKLPFTEMLQFTEQGDLLHIQL